MRPRQPRRVLWGAAFLMATSAVGPGFLTQTTVFTQSLAASFGFVILASILIDIAVQLNIWRVIAVSEKRAQDIANLVLPGLGYFISGLIVLGGLAFNIGNVAGAGLGLQVLLGISAQTGALLAAALAIGVFLVKEAGKAMDRFSQAMGLLLIGLIGYVAATSAPPLGQALAGTFAPEQVDLVAIVTLVGGTVGGYITFAGGHRLLDAGVSGRAALPQVTTSAVSGIGVSSLIRVGLFLASLGVVSQGLAIDAGNPPAAVFQLAAGKLGYKIFGVVMFSAAITSVIGSAYTSVSFIRSFHPAIDRQHNRVIVAFILLSTGIFVILGRPIHLLILAGALNGFILPVTLGTILVAAHRRQVVGDYRHPWWLTFSGLLVVGVMIWMSGTVLINQLPRLLGAGAG